MDNVEDKEGEKSHGFGPQKSIFFQSEVGSEIESILRARETVNHAFFKIVVQQRQYVVWNGIAILWIR